MPSLRVEAHINRHPSIVERQCVGHRLSNVVYGIVIGLGRKTGQPAKAVEPAEEAAPKPKRSRKAAAATDAE